MSEPQRGARGGMTPGARHAVVALFTLMMAIGGANLFWTSHQVSNLRTAVLASCAFAADLGSVPIPPAPKPSKLGISLVADSRQQWRKLGCPGHLPPPQPVFARWARIYGLPPD